MTLYACALIICKQFLFHITSVCLCADAYVCVYLCMYVKYMVVYILHFDKDFDHENEEWK